jgi:Zn-dependent metalloprotease
MWSEGDPPAADPLVRKAAESTAQTLALFSRYGRDSLDGKGGKVISTVHYKLDCCNAFWNGRQMVFGDGDGRIFKAFSRSRSVAGHEMTHGVIQHSCQLHYRGESGALNESLSDVFGALVVQRGMSEDAADATWVVGEDLFQPAVSGSGIRSLKAPGTAYDDPVLGVDPQPFHMDDFVVTRSDYGGVHINSGIPNHAFYLMAMMIGGRAWEKAGALWYSTMVSLDDPKASFADFAAASWVTVRGMFGQGSMEELYVKRAWKLVGIDL